MVSSTRYGTGSLKAELHAVGVSLAECSSLSGDSKILPVPGTNWDPRAPIV